jgi:hypothetical protein
MKTIDNIFAFLTHNTVQFTAIYKLISCCSVLIIIIYLALVKGNYQGEESCKIHIVILFTPLILQFIFWAFKKSGNNKTLHVVNNFILSVYIIFHYSFWAVYSFRSDFKERDLLELVEWTSYLSIGLSFILVVIAFFVTWCVLEIGKFPSYKFQHIKDFTIGLQANSFLMICFFLVIFLYVTYFIGFSLALHDKYERLNSLNADVGLHKNSISNSAQGYRDVEKIKYDMKTHLPGNQEELNKLEEFAKRIDKKVEDKKHIRITIVSYGYGETDPQLISMQVHTILGKQLKYPNNIEWVTKHQEIINEYKTQIDCEPPCVEISAAEIPENKLQLTLLDYLYFTTYTITTTGYGDIVPVSDYAKLIVSFANFFEMFFIVIFFNVLLSIASKRKVHSKETTKPIDFDITDCFINKTDSYKI